MRMRHMVCLLVLSLKVTLCLCLCLCLSDCLSACLVSAYLSDSKIRGIFWLWLFYWRTADRQTADSRPFSF